MTDQQLALQAVSEAQRILEEYLEPRPHNHERILDRLVEVLERPDLVVAVDGIRGPRGSRGIGAGLAAIDLPTFNRKIRNDQTSRVEGAARIIFVN